MNGAGGMWTSSLPLALRLLLAVLASWRLTRLLTREDGPGNTIARLRRALGATALGALMDCFACTGLWVSAPLACYISLRFGDWLLSWLGIAGAVLCLDSVLPQPLLIETLSAPIPAGSDCAARNPDLNPGPQSGLASAPTPPYSLETHS
jgi:hypothetical protein